MAKASDRAGPGAEELLPLHPHDFRILMALAEGPSYGTEIVRGIEAAEGGAKLYPANLFRRVRDLLQRGLLEECRAPADADPRRTYVRLTGRGRQVAQAEASRLRDLVREAAALDLLPGG
ncbi:MAG TPA: helix-turn-helix transcriptional regulator [Longimicrobiales bacterium]|nr:helix-turn-helix transcriptional regulator [Longimicrobiales bacterium]